MMGFFASDNADEVIVVTYCFMLYQYTIRNNEWHCYAKLPYPKNSYELCCDISSNKTTNVANTGMNKIFYHFGLLTDFEFCDDGSVSIKFNSDTDRNVLLSEANFLLTLLQDENGLRSEIAKAQYYKIAKLQITNDKNIKFSTESVGARALGLFLWDYCSEKGGTNIRRNQAAAIRHIKQDDWKHILAGLGYAASEDSVFRRILRNTIKCIENRQVGQI